MYYSLFLSLHKNKICHVIRLPLHQAHWLVLPRSRHVWEKHQKVKWRTSPAKWDPGMTIHSPWLKNVKYLSSLEGWHNALNRRAGGHCGLPFYYLIEILEKEVEVTEVTIRLFSDKKIQRNRYKNIQARL